MMFGDRLRSLREDNDISTEEFSKAMHISKRALNYYEHNFREPSFPLVVKMADYFNVSLDYMFCRTNTLEPFRK